MKQARFLKGLYLPYFWGPLLILMIFLLLVFFTNLKSFTYEKANENLKSLSHLLHKEYKGPFLAKDLETLQKKIDIDSQKLQVKISFFKENKLLLEDKSVYLKEEDPALKFEIPFKKNGEYLQISKPLKDLHDDLRYIVFLMCLIIVVLLAFIILLNYTLTKKLIRPLKSMKNYALKIAEGDFSKKISIKERQYKEMKQLGHALNKMKDQLEGRIQTIVKNKNEKEAVFSSMIEGVLTVDLNGRIIDLNNVTRKLFKLESNHNYKGSPLEQLVNNKTIQKITTQLLKENAPIDTEIDLEGQKIIRLQGSPLKSMDEKIGALLVLNDVTRLRKLERHRKEFVGNVSHELRTPLTAILGFVETITEGKVDDLETQNRFISIIQKQANRLYAIIEDLLDLSRIEKEAEGEGNRIEMTNQDIKNIIDLALVSCQPNAKKKNISLKVNCPELLKGNFNSILLVRAISNLIDNAIKYGPNYSNVEITAFKNKNKLILSVKDQGPGIDEKHHERLFERFYSVDKARSKELGGSGIGLAIVKHIALAHGGQVKVESSPGKGSTFSLQLSH
ncbi:ATP-binding protein [Bacteriovoracales bacterium]|nr:ATP-binding protein [Bacteriovoracales bacterium]